MGLKLPVRHKAAVCTGSALLMTALPFTLSACSDTAPAGRQPSTSNVLSRASHSSSVTSALERQAAALQKAAQQTAAQREAVTKSQQGDEREADMSTPRPRECTTDPADRPACRNPSGKIDPNGGDLDRDGKFEKHEPVGPGYRDPRAYDGGKTSGETQCEWLRAQGIAC